MKETNNFLTPVVPYATPARDRYSSWYKYLFTVCLSIPVGGSLCLRKFVNLSVLDIITDTWEESSLVVRNVSCPLTGSVAAQWIKLQPKLHVKRGLSSVVGCYKLKQSDNIVVLYLCSTNLIAIWTKRRLEWKYRSNLGW